MLFYHHLQTLEESSLAKQIVTIQLEENLPGLASECTEFLRDLDISIHPSCLSKAQWNKLIINKIHNQNQIQILSRIESYKKLDHAKLSAEHYGLKEYLKNMNIFDARTLFASRSQMLRTVRMSFKNMYAEDDL